MTIATTADAGHTRERERIAHLVLGQPRPPVELPRKPKGISQRAWKAQRAELRKVGSTLSPGIEEAVALREAWSHRQGTPETLERAARTHQGTLARLCRSGEITANQLAAAEQIAAVAEAIRSAVALPCASWETRVDKAFRPELAGLEAAGRVKSEMAYTRWRALVPGPLSMLLAIIVDGEPYTGAAARHRVGPKRAKRVLGEALDLWWRCRAEAGRAFDPEEMFNG